MVTKTSNLLKSMKTQNMKVTPIGTEIILPNLSGITVHPEFKKVTSPIGSVIAWLKSYTNTPALPSGWVECNGQTLSDAGSVYNGQVIPDLNGYLVTTQRFLRGSTSTGSIGGCSTHSHVLPTCSVGLSTYCTQEYKTATDEVVSLPPYYSVTWIMRVK